MPAFPFFLFGIVGLLAAFLDLRMLRAGGLCGVARLTRHLWRMTFALLIAALSFFLGQAKVFPQAVRIPGFLALPVLAVLVNAALLAVARSLPTDLSRLRCKFRYPLTGEISSLAGHMLPPA